MAVSIFSEYKLEVEKHGFQKHGILRLVSTFMQLMCVSVKRDGDQIYFHKAVPSYYFLSSAPIKESKNKRI